MDPYQRSETVSNKRGIRADIMLLAWPAIIEMLMATLVQFVDTAMVSRLGPSVIAAVAINMPPVGLLTGVIAGIGVGTIALVARYIGAKENSEASRATKQSFIAGAAVSLVITGLVLAAGGKIPVWMGAEPDVAPLASVYLKILSSTFILRFSSMILMSALRGAGDTKTPMLVNITANILNIIGNFLLIYPVRTVRAGGFSMTFWGAGLGITGAAISTAVSCGIGGLIVIAIIYGRRSVLDMKLGGSYRPDPVMIGRIFRIGFPAAIERFVLSSGQVLFTKIVAGLGTVQLAAHHIAIIAESISYMPGFGFSIAATTLVGQMLGAGDRDRADRYSKETLKLGVIVMSLMGLLFYLFPQYLMMIFTKEPEVISYGVKCLRIVAFCQPFFASAMIQSGALRGAGDTRWPLYITMTCIWGIRLTGAWIFVYVFDLGLTGAWLGMVLDLSVRGILSYARFRTGKWKDIEFK